jgi:hypothetical protein
MQISLVSEHTAMRIEGRFKKAGEQSDGSIVDSDTHSRTIIENGCGVVKRTA